MELGKEELREIRDQLLDIRRSERDLERSIDKKIAEVIDKIHEVSEKLSVEIAGLKVMSAVFGMIAGALPGIVMFVFDVVTKKGD